MRLINLLLLYRKTSLCILVLAVLSSKAEASQLRCEKTENVGWGDVGTQKTCRMKEISEINSPSSIISLPPDNSVTGLDLGYNKKINHLPIKVYETFPNLVLYMANDCSLKTISRLNFENLTKLKSLWLSNNQIEKVDSRIFESLLSLQWLHLSKLHWIFFLVCFSQIIAK